MDLTPQDVRDVQFREKMRGYHQDDVDQFLVQVASTLERLHLRLQEAEARATTGASKTEELAATEESLKRTLVLAQRTADLAMQEAREEADRLLADARAEHERLQTQSAEIKRQLIDESQEDIRTELAALEARRDALVADVAALESFVASERERLSATLRDTLDRLDDGAFDLGQQPPLQVEVPAAVTPPVDVAGGGPGGPLEEPATPPESAVDPGPPTQAMAAVNGLDNPYQDRTDVDLRDGASAPAAGEPGDLEQPPAEDHDPFLAELRRAVTDEEPLGPRSDDLAAAAPADDDEEIDFYERDREVSGRVGSRLRRRR